MRYALFGFWQKFSDVRDDGHPEPSEDSGGLMRYALSEFWETFYVQYIEGNPYKASVLRHDMLDDQWMAVAAVIKLGVTQKNMFPM